MSSRAQADGLAWEREAARFLEGRGLTIVERGYRCRVGEIDLICRDGPTLVIVEVRARRSSSHGSAAATVDWRKRRKIVQASRHYLMLHADSLDMPIRFDVVAIDGIASREPSLEWIRNAFDAG